MSTTEGAIREIERMAKAAMTPVKLPVEDPTGRVHIAMPKGDIKVIDVPPEPFTHQLNSLQAFKEFAEKEGGEDSRIFYSPTGITILMDYGTRRDSAVLPFVATPTFAWLNKAGEKKYKQPEFVRLLRIDLKEALHPDSKLLELVRHLKFQTVDTERGELRHNRESMGGEINAMVEGATDLPEELQLSVKLWNEVDLEAHIQCALEVHSQERSFSIVPFPNEIRRAIDGAMEYLKGELTEEGLPQAHYGTP